ncbi:DUF1364 domain-containing protein [Zhongshania sp.]|uniref:DUF1364 domain-containing protein n=1 Tax=Zhongshania sp. TaxID=1971902 RepID=UPI003561E702
MKVTSKKIRDAARGQPCTLNIPGVCSYDDETTVLCHFPDEYGGMGTKPSDLSAGFGCMDCHDELDRRTRRIELDSVDREFFMRRSQSRTLGMLVALGIVSVAGAK